MSQEEARQSSLWQASVWDTFQVTCNGQSYKVNSKLLLFLFFITLQPRALSAMLELSLVQSSGE
jgi:hypothetical protein